MCQIAQQLLSEKLIDDFYKEYAQTGKSQNTENLADRLKAQLPTEQHELFYCWEVVYAEHGGEKLRQFANFVAGVLLTAQYHKEEGGGCDI